MNSLSVHPATMRLLAYRASRSLSKALGSFRGRRLVLSLLAAGLAIVWLGQALTGLLFREAADPAKLAIWIPLALLAYTVWHLLKSVCREPIEPFEWTAAENEFLGGAPLSRGELVMYRLTSIGAAALAKALCFSVIMLPDVSVWWAALAGMFMALLFVDLCRMAFEIIAYGVSRRVFLYLRAGVLIGAVLGAAAAIAATIDTPSPSSENVLPASLDIILRLVTAVMGLHDTPAGWIADAPFRVFGAVILAPALSSSLAAMLALAAAMVLAGIRSVIWLDARFIQKRNLAERERFAGLTQGQVDRGVAARGAHATLRVPWRFKGAGSLAWRQLRAALGYRTSLLIALSVPATLSCIGLVRRQSAMATMVELAASLIFYSFLLLPTALKFDFRRDIDRFATLKALPIGPMAVTIGQLAVPVVLSTLFQAAVLLLGLAVRPLHPDWVLIALVGFVPVNVLIFASENLLFLLYPYRLNQEGIGVFFRSILTFTAKAIVFAIGLGITLVWAMSSQWISSFWATDHRWAASAVIFTVGMWLATSAVAAAATWALARAFRHFDPSQDTPVMS